LQKVRIENFSKQIDKVFNVSFSRFYFCFVAFFFRASRQWEFKNFLHKHFVENLYQKIVSKNFYKKSCRKTFTKNRPKIDKIICFLEFFNHVWGVSRRRDFEKISKNESDPGPFFMASDPPTHHGVRRFFWRPLDHTTRYGPLICGTAEDIRCDAPEGGTERVSAGTDPRDLCSATENTKCGCRGSL
jgi:hypothetical protein